MPERPERMLEASLPRSACLKRGEGAKSRAVKVLDLRRLCLRFCLADRFWGKERGNVVRMRLRAGHNGKIVKGRSERRVRAHNG